MAAVRNGLTLPRASTATLDAPAARP